MLTALLLFLLTLFTLVLTVGVTVLVSVALLRSGLLPEAILEQLPSAFRAATVPLTQLGLEVQRMTAVRPVTAIVPRPILVIHPSEDVPQVLPLDAVSNQASEAAITQHERQEGRGGAGNVARPAGTIVVLSSETPIVSPRARRPAVLIHPATDDLLTVAPGQAATVSPTNAVAVAPSEPSVIERPPRAVWDEQGWLRREKDGAVVYEGRFQAVDRRGRQHRLHECPGRITQQGRTIQAYIADPPDDLRHHHPKGACFWWYGEEGGHAWFYVNWTRKPKDAEGALLYVERVLDETFNKYSR